MQGTMLKNEHSAIDADDLTVGKRFLQLCECFLVFFCLMIGRHQYRSVDDEKIGMGGRKPIALFVKARVGEWKWEKCIGKSLKSAEGKKFLFHRL